MKEFHRVRHGGDRMIMLQLSEVATLELLDFLKYVGDHFTECADEHLSDGEHDTRRVNLELAAIAARHWLEINHQVIFDKPSRPPPR
jgi:hypothetical protein